MLQVNNLKKNFGGITAVSNITFSVPKGTIYSVIGPNGAGKTTLFNLLTGIYTPSQGSIRFKNNELVGLSPDRIACQGITRTFQNLQIFFNMTVMENVKVGCHLRTKSGLLSAAFRLPVIFKEEQRVKKMAQEALIFCGLESIAHREASSLSYGDLKKVEIARALARDPDLILLDEPAAGLNETETMELRDLIQRIRDAGITVILVEHHMALVMDVSDRVLVLNYGVPIAEGTPEEIQKNPDVIAAYLGT